MSVKSLDSNLRPGGYGIILLIQMDIGLDIIQIDIGLFKHLKSLWFREMAYDVLTKC